MPEQSAAMAEAYLREYRSLILQSIQKHDGTPIPNGTREHASVLMEAFFKTALKRIWILTGELNPRVYGTPDVVAYCRQYLADRKHSLEIIFESNIDDGEIGRHPLLSTICASASVRLWRLKQEVRDEVPSHFCVMDDDCYRFEADKHKPSAIAAFGDPSFTGKLSEVFHTLRDRACTELRLRAYA